MELHGTNVVITGAGSGIGAAMARAFAAEGASHLWLADLAADQVEAVAAELGPVATATPCDVADEQAVIDLVARAGTAGPIDLFCANAGIGTGLGLEASDEVWNRIWSVNLMSHVYAARACLPGWLERGRGYLLTTASAAGLLTNLGDAPYTATKHAAVGLAEWISITHGDAGVKVSCLCPQGVRTPLVTNGLAEDQLATQVVELMGIIEPEACAAAVVQGLRDERLLILPHPEVVEYMTNKATQHERWLGGMRKLQRALTSSS